MQKILVLLIILFSSNIIFANELVGIGQYYPTLKSAFDDINNGTLTGNVVLEITSNTTETATCQLNANGFGFASYSSVKIYPTVSGITINGSIFLRDADHVTIDGRVNATGSSADMKIISSSSAISLMDAEYDKIQYCYLQGNGSVVLITGCLGTCYGNGVNYCNINHNIISYNNRYGEQFALVRFFANQPSMPHHDTISNNEFKDFFAWNQFSFGYTGVVPYGLFIGVGAYSWVIDENSFYDTGFTLTTRNCSPRAIATSPTIGGAAHRITNNYIGGSAPMCGGAPMTITSTSNGEIQFIGIVTGANNDTLLVENNTISNISLENCKHTATTQPYSFVGIYVYEGNAKLINNTIGSANSAGNITVSTTVGGDTVFGIYNPSDDKITMDNNKIGGIITTNSSATFGTSIFGIYNNNALGKVKIINNKIGSTTILNSIISSGNSTNSFSVVGISSLRGDSTLIDHSDIQHLQNDCSTTGQNGTYGIEAYGAGQYTVSNNKIAYISSASRSSVSSKSALAGIVVDPTNGVKISNIKLNTISNLSCTNSNADDNVVNGIYAAIGGPIVQNFIHSLSTTSTGPQTQVNGICGSSPQLNNNIISLGNSSRRVYGINSITGYFYHNFNNTVFITGTSNAESACHRTPSSTYMFNNNFYNDKQNQSGTSTRHFGIILTAANVNAADNNNYYVPNLSNGGATARVSGADKSTLSDYQLAISREGNSISTNPMFIQAGGTNAADYYPTATLIGTDTMNSIYIGGLDVPIDYFGNNRGGIRWMGALQSQTPLPIIWKSFKVKLNEQNSSEINWSTSSETNTLLFEIEKSTDAKTWYVIEQQKAVGNSDIENSYNTVDNQVAFGTTYYRIKQIDLDHKYTYSSVNKVTRSNNSNVTIYPNPVMNTLNITLNNEVENTLIEIYSLEGKMIMSEKTNNLNHAMNVASLTKGTYMIRISNKEKTYTSKFVRQ